MELEFKPDFEAIRKRWDAFWRGENTRPALAAVLPKPGVESVSKPPYTAGRDGNFTPVIDQLLRWAETHEFLGEALPFFYLEFAADHFATFLGADLRFHESGNGHGWAVPFIKDWDADEIRFRREGKWWEFTVQFAEALRARCDGKLLIASPTMVANLDALAALRGTEELLADLVDQPDKVHRALDQLTRAYAEILDALAELLGYESYGCINRFGMYSRGRVNVPQCDFSCMISAGMFREFVVPYLRREMQLLDQSTYHLDGPGALQHLEALCEIDELDLVQWQPGAGRGQQQDWTWLYDRIDALGKGQYRGGTPEAVKRMWERHQSRKLFCAVSVQSREEFEGLVEEMEA